MEVRRQEIYRYLGIRGEPDERTRQLAEECVAELSERCTPRYVHRDYPLTLLPDDLVDLGCFTVKSRSLSRNLKNCERVILFAATLGEAPDFLIRRYSRVEISRAVVMQAASAAMIEAWCNEIVDTWKAEYAEKSLYLRPRFSPGYGDFALEEQVRFCDALKTEKTVGITLTDSLLMMPSKSVTAVIGISRVNAGCSLHGCEACRKTDCPYRR